MAPLYRLADRLRYRKDHNLGRRGEDLAHRYLRARGFIIAARNWRPPQGGGEIDIIAWENASGQTSLVFIEVKTRSSDAWSPPERAIDAEKMRVLRRAARDYIRRSGADPARVRFDAISITGGKLEHFREAFTWDLSLY
ncbi:MAG TPA: YraN family protein [Bryobacteraceae bacterium]|nr:YraN family protein [Bryobacteraceae bacterium]